MQAWFDAASCKEGHARIGGGHIDFRTSKFKCLPVVVMTKPQVDADHSY
jgi:hypothetical protein